jgi:hypothetical protein
VITIADGSSGCRKQLIVTFLCKHISTKISGDFAELFEGGFKIFDDFLSENI